MKRTVKRRRDFYQYNCRISIKKNTKSTGMAGSDKLDAGLQKIINQALNGILDTDREDNAPVTSEDMEELTSLVIDSGDDVEDLDGLRYAVNLTSLSVYGDMADCRTGHKRRQRGNLEIFRVDRFCRKRSPAGYRILVF